MLDAAKPMAMHSMRNLAFWPFCADSAIYPVISISLLFMVYSESKPPFLPSIRGRLAGPRHKKRADLGGGQRCPLDVATVLSRPSAAVGVPMQHDMFRGPLPAKVRPARLSERSMDPPDCGTWLYTGEDAHSEHDCVYRSKLRKKRV